MPAVCVFGGGRGQGRGDGDSTGMTEPMITQDARLMAGSRAEQATGDRELSETAPRLVNALDTHTLITVAPEPLPPVPPSVLPATPQTPRQGKCASVGPGIQSSTRDRSCKEPTRTKAADPWDSLQSEPNSSREIGDYGWN